MTRDIPGQSEPSGLPDPQDGEQPRDAVLGHAPGGEPGLDAYGIPVQDQPAEGRIVLAAISWIIAIAITILGAVSAGLGITHSVSHHRLDGHLVGLGNAVGLLAGALAFVVPIWWLMAVKSKHAKVIITIGLVGGALGALGTTMLTGLPNCC